MLDLNRDLIAGLKFKRSEIDLKSARVNLVGSDLPVHLYLESAKTNPVAREPVLYEEVLLLVFSFHHQNTRVGIHADSAKDGQNGKQKFVHFLHFSQRYAFF